MIAFYCFIVFCVFYSCLVWIKTSLMLNQLNQKIQNIKNKKEKKILFDLYGQGYKIYFKLFSETDAHRLMRIITIMLLILFPHITLLTSFGLIFFITYLEWAIIPSMLLFDGYKLLKNYKYFKDHVLNLKIELEKKRGVFDVNPS